MRYRVIVHAEEDMRGWVGHVVKVQKQKYTEKLVSKCFAVVSVTVVYHRVGTRVTAQDLALSWYRIPLPREH